MEGALLLLLKAGVAALLLVVGMSSTFAGAAYLWRRPALLARSLLAMYIVVPVAIFGLVRALELAPAIKAALLVLAVSAGAPLLPRRLSALGGDYVFSLVMTSSVLAVVLVPAWVALLAHYFQVQAEISYGVVAWALARGFVLPLVLGMALRHWYPRTAARLAARLGIAATVLLLACCALLLALQWELLLRVGWAGAGALAGALLIALAIGHALGGPQPEERTALAVCCATRHIGIALLVAGSFPGPRTLVLLLAYLLASAAVTIPYLWWRKRIGVS
jgi:BASS family bile acid:Na+ symporter